jgi:predicted dehydrogenase
MDPLGVAIIGLHHLHARGWAWNVNRIPDLALVAIADEDRVLLDRVAADLGGVRALQDSHGALALEDVAVAIILLPHDQMPAAAVDALRSGKHVIVEKPCAVSAPSFRPVIDAVAATGRAFTTPYLWRYDPVVIRAREITGAGEIGRVAYLAGRINAGGPDRYRELSPWMVRKAQSGGGPFLNLGVHWVDALSWLAGDEPVAVTGQVGRLAAPRLDVEDHARALLEFAGGQQALVETSYVMPASYPPLGYDFALLIKGTAGYIEWSQREDILLVCSRDGGVRTEALDRTAGGWTDAQGYGGANGLQFLADFASAARQGRPPAITAQDALRALRVADAVYESAATGATVRLQPRPERRRSLA